MEKNKLIYEVKEAVRALSNDAKVTNALILHHIDVLRAKYIRQHQKRNPGEDKVSYTQTLFFDTELVDRSYLPATVSLSMNILRISSALPRIIGRGIFKNIEIRPIDRIHQEIEFMPKDRAMFISGANDGFIYSFLDDDLRLYFIGKDKIHQYLKRVAVTVILEVPTEIETINSLSTELTDYPLSESMWALMRDEVIQSVLQASKIPVDVVDDNQAET